MSDTPELGRLVVLHHAIIHGMIGPGINPDDGMLAIMKEADALVVRIAQRTRSAINYHETDRGKAALNDAARIAEKRADPAYDGEDIELEDKTWSLEQVSNGQIMPGMEPERTLRRRVFVNGLEFLSPDLTRDK